MDIEVGEYVKLQNGKIRKIISTVAQYYITDKLNINEDNQYTIQNIVKHSKNIIDLIEVGDYVNGEPVERIETGLDWGREIATTTQYLTNEEDIETVVTKEQFENIEYKVGD